MIVAICKEYVTKFNGKFNGNESQLLIFYHAMFTLWQYFILWHYLDAKQRWVKKNRPTLGPSISETKCDRDKPFFSAESGGQSNGGELQISDWFRLKIPKIGVITTELPFHA